MSSLVALIPTIGAVDVQELGASVSALQDAGASVKVVSNARSVTEDLAERADIPWVTSLRNEGFGASIRTGLIGDDWEWVLIFNDDISLTEDAARAMVKQLQVYQGAPCFKVVHFGESQERRIPGPFDVFLNFSLLGKVGSMSQRRARSAGVNGRYSSFNSVAISRAIWDRVGGFDKRLIFTFEDADFIRRCVQVDGFEVLNVDIRGIEKQHSVSSIAYSAQVLAVSAWSAREYLSIRGYPRWRANSLLNLALLVRSFTGLASTVGFKKNLESVRNAIAALSRSNPPSLPLYEEL